VAQTFDAKFTIPKFLLGKTFGVEGLQAVREEIADGRWTTRSAIARQLCIRLGWRSPGGAAALMSARVALLRLHREGLVTLPSPRGCDPNRQRLKTSRMPTKLPEPQPLEARFDELEGLCVVPVESAVELALHNALLERHHYLGYCAMAGAQMRYLVRWRGQVLCALGFGACAWRLASREEFIGWSDAQRRARLHLVVNNSRFLILPWVRCPNLGSGVLGLCARRIGGDFARRYGYAPVLLESFVEEPRFTGTVYRAASWTPVGMTVGRGKKGSHHEGLPRKRIWLRPLGKDFRKVLCAPLSGGACMGGEQGL
jgi:hypothetical protein